MSKIRYCLAMTMALLCVMTAFQPISHAGTNEITMATFNLQHFGKEMDQQRIQRVADLCRSVDLLILQEIFPTGVESVKLLASKMGSEYQVAISDETTWERFAFIWREPVISLTKPYLMETPKLGRKPFIGEFRAGSFDFMVVNLHLFWDGSKKTYPHTRSVEFKLLDDWLAYRQDEELDVIFAGDFNAPNMYYGTQFPPPLSSHYFFYEFLSRHGLVSVTIEKGIPTSIANENIYDHFVFNPAHNFVEEFSGFDSVKVVKWDLFYDKNQDGKLDWSEHTRAREAVTDHRLVKANFRINLPDDDEEDVPPSVRDDKNLD